MTKDLRKVRAACRRELNLHGSGIELQPVCAKCGLHCPREPNSHGMRDPAGTAPGDNEDATAGSLQRPTRQEEGKKPVANEAAMSGISERGLFQHHRGAWLEGKGARDINLSSSTGANAAQWSPYEVERSKIPTRA